MNERIKELAEQAGLKVESWMTNPPKPFQILGGTEQFEKFAELIVRDCAYIAENKYKYNTEENRWDSGFEISHSILEHFGVEE